MFLVLLCEKPVKLRSYLTSQSRHVVVLQWKQEPRDISIVNKYMANDYFISWLLMVG